MVKMEEVVGRIGNGRRGGRDGMVEKGRVKKRGYMVMRWDGGLGGGYKAKVVGEV